MPRDCCQLARGSNMFVPTPHRRRARRGAQESSRLLAEDNWMNQNALVLEKNVADVETMLKLRNGWRNLRGKIKEFEMSSIQRGNKCLNYGTIQPITPLGHIRKQGILWCIASLSNVVENKNRNQKNKNQPNIIPCCLACNQNFSRNNLCKCAR